MKKYLNNEFHFPTEWQAVIFRSYGWVPAGDIAAVLRCSEAEVEKNARLLGLPYEIGGGVKMRRGYLTALRANWNLLPRHQLLRLLNLAESEFEKLWFEEDFLFVKLSKSAAAGDIFYSPLSDAELEQTERIAKLVSAECTSHEQDYFQFYKAHQSFDNAGIPIECSDSVQIYADFVKENYDLSFLAGRAVLTKENNSFTGEEFEISTEGGITVTGAPLGIFRGLQYLAENRILSGKKRVKPKFRERIIYDYEASCSNFEVSGLPKEAFLTGLAKKQVNGIFIHGLLRTLAPFPFDLSQSAHCGDNIRFLNEYIMLARKYGIKLYLYLNEPRSMPLKFFEKDISLLGARTNELGCLCMSTEAVKKWMSDAMEYLVSQLEKDFGGFITITASENATNCKWDAFSSGRGACPRCADRNLSELSADVNNTMYRAAVKANPQIAFFAWLWGQDEETALKTVEGLDKGIIVANVSETSIPVSHGGRETVVIDYSMSNIGPGERYKRIGNKARATGHSTLAKVQVNNTWECSAVPFIPVFPLVEEHITALSENTDSLLLSWTLGGYPSPNLDIVKALCFDGEKDFYQANFGEYADLARNAAELFSEGFRQFPFHLDLIYHSPVNYGCMNLFYLNKTGMNSTMVGFPYDDIESWKGCYTKEIIRNQFDILTRKWKQGLLLLESYADTPELNELYVVANSAYIQLRSTYLQIEFILNREYKDKTAYLIKIIDEEAELTRQMLQIQSADKRIGFEASNHYYFNRNSLLEKMVNLAHIKGILAP